MSDQKENGLPSIEERLDAIERLNKTQLRPSLDVIDAEKELWDRIWSYRHLVRISNDEVNAKEAEIYRKWTAQKLEKYGPNPPCGLPTIAARLSDFDWGFLQGKISAIRWVLGEEWDFLDT